MARYIDADKLEKDFPQSVSKHNVIINGNEYPVFLVDHVLHKIRNYPTADVVEVKHGEWKPTNIPAYFGGVIYECSLCGAKDGDHTKVLGRYCWRCGAKMDGGKTE